MKNVNFRRAALKTEWWAAQKSGLTGYRKGRGGLQKRATLRPALFLSPAQYAARRPALMCSPLARPVVQSAGSCASVHLASPWKIHVFHLGTRPSV